MANDSTAVAIRQRFKQDVQAIIGSTASLLPKHMTPERMYKLVYGAATKTPKLFECTTASIGMCLTTCSEIGLEPGDIRGHVYLIPRGNECTLLVGYKGYCELARRSGDIEAIDATVVYDGEIFQVTRGLSPNIDHVMSMSVDRSDDKLIAAYAIVRLKSGSTVFEVLTRSEIEKHRSRAQSRNNGPWVTDFARMARKTALRSLFTGGLVPMSAEIVRAIEIDHDDDVTDSRDVQATTRMSASASLRQLATAATEPDVETQDESPVESHLVTTLRAPVDPTTMDRDANDLAPMAADIDQLDGTEQPPMWDLWLVKATAIKATLRANKGKAVIRELVDSTVEANRGPLTACPDGHARIAAILA